MSFNTSSSVIDDVIAAASFAAPSWAASAPQERSKLLRGLAEQLEANLTELVTLADEETFLGSPRLNGELARTAYQLRGFAEQVDRGTPFAFVDDPAVAGPPPVGHPAMVRVRVPVGVVAMFSASNFPFAFSVLGGDTASALAAGCPVVVKAHPGHPRLSRRIHELAVQVLKAQGQPQALIGFIEGSSISVGIQVIRHPLIAAAAFTGSLRGGLALQAEAHTRSHPIPFYGELGSVNPMIILPSALKGHAEPLALSLAQSITVGTGQFCTRPGIVLLFGNVDSSVFIAALCDALNEQKTHAMLTPAIRSGFDTGVRRLAGRAGVTPLLTEKIGEQDAPQPFLARTDAGTFVRDRELHDEVFGPAALIVEVNNVREVIEVLAAIGGSLTATIWGANTESDENIKIVRAAIQIAGRVLFGGVPTGVAVTTAQHHGGPFPSSTQPFATSVGYAALDRFLRPVALQDPPEWIKMRQGLPL